MLSTLPHPPLSCYEASINRSGQLLEFLFPRSSVDIARSWPRKMSRVADGAPQRDRSKRRGGEGVDVPAEGESLNGAPVC